MGSGSLERAFASLVLSNMSMRTSMTNETATLVCLNMTTPPQLVHIGRLRSAAELQIDPPSRRSAENTADAVHLHATPMPMPDHGVQEAQQRLTTGVDGSDD